MPEYDFHGLSSIDFEILVRDLLQEELGVRLENFKAGRDGGIDLRYASAHDGTLIVQCKHTPESRFPDLLRKLRKEEVAKVARLAPQRYLFATSLGLTPGQKNDLVEAFAPYITSPADVFGREDLNNLLGRYPAIERRTFKLWMTSTAIFEEILHSKTRNVSREALERIREKARLYVRNESFDEALNILEEHHFCVIAGIPGIGKTTLADMLVLHYIDHGYEFVKITDDIGEAYTDSSPQEKRVYYYDDFLGQTSLTEKLGRKEDQRLLDFIEMIKRSKRSKLILTTREYILNQARQVYEKIGRARYDVQTYVVDLHNYTRLIRAQILFNHFYFSDLPGVLKKSLLADRTYLEVIDHPNYNPRLIELMTDPARVRTVSPVRYMKFFLSSLDNPMDIWGHVFDMQLSQSARDLLVVLVTMPYQVFVEDLEEAFLAFHKGWAGKYGASTGSQDFKNALRELEGNFIRTEKSRDRVVVAFHNPSVRDFLESYLNTNSSAVLTLVQESVYLAQLQWFWEPKRGWKQEEGHYFRRILSEPSAGLVAALRRLLDSPDCRLIHAQIRTGESYRTIWKTSYEERATLVISITGIVKGAESEQLRQEVLEEVRERIRAGDSDFQDLVMLLEEVKEQGQIESPVVREILASSRDFLFAHLDTPDEFQAYCRLSQCSPEVFPDNERAEVGEWFLEMVEEVLAAYTAGALQPQTASPYNNPDAIAYDTEMIISTAKQLNVDVGHVVHKLYERAATMEVSAESSRQHPRSRKANTNQVASTEIDSIFTMLRS